MGNARENLLTMLAEKSFRLGNFKLSSGGTSDYYIDCRLTTLDAAGAVATGEAVLQAIHDHGWEADAIGGLTMGADGATFITAGVAAPSICQTNTARKSPAVGAMVTVYGTDSPEFPAERTNETA